jgi:hypothetical protein
MSKKKTGDDERRQERDSRLAEGELLARAVVGRSEKSALRRARKDGFEVEVLSASGSGWLTSDLGFNRIRLYVDEKGLVVKASAG